MSELPIADEGYYIVDYGDHAELTTRGKDGDSMLGSYVWGDGSYCPAIDHLEDLGQTDYQTVIFRVLCSCGNPATVALSGHGFGANYVCEACRRKAENKAGMIFTDLLGRS